MQMDHHVKGKVEHRRRQSCAWKGSLCKCMYRDMRQLTPMWTILQRSVWANLETPCVGNTDAPIEPVVSCLLCMQRYIHVLSLVPYICRGSLTKEITTWTRWSKVWSAHCWSEACGCRKGWNMSFMMNTALGSRQFRSKVFDYAVH